MGSLSPQMANNLSFDEIVTEFETRGISNMPHETLTDLLSRVNDVITENNNTVDDIGAENDNIRDELDELESSVDRLKTSISDNSDAIENFLNNGNLVVDTALKNSDNQVIETHYRLELSNGEVFNKNTTVHCMQVSDDTSKVHIDIFNNGYHEKEINGEYHNDIDNIRSVVMPHLISSLYKTLNESAIEGH